MMDLIKVNGDYLKVPDGFCIPFQEENPLFSDDVEIRGSWSFPVTVPNDAEGHNARLLEHPHLINVITQLPRIYDCQAYIGGTWRRDSKLKLIQASSKQFEFVVYQDFFMLNPELADKTIGELFTEAIEILPAPEIRIKFFGDGSGTSDLTFRINDFEYFGIPWNTDINTTLNDIADIVNADTLNNGVTMEVSGDTFEIVQNAPGPKCVIDYSAVTATESGTFTINLDNETDWLLEYNDDLHDALLAVVELKYAADNPACFPTIRNIGAYGINEAGDPERNADFSGFINYTKDDATLEYLLNFKTGETHDLNKFSLSPQLFNQLVWDAIMTEAGVATEGDITLLDDWGRIHFYNNRLLDCTFTTQYGITETYLTFYNSFMPADHLPDMTVPEYLNSVKKFLCLAFFFDPVAPKITIVQRKVPERDNSSVELNDTPFVDDPLLMHEKSISGIRWIKSNDENDLYITENTYLEQHADFVAEDGSHEIESSIAIVSVDEIHREENSGHFITVPVVNQKCSGLEFGLEINDFTPRFLIYRGLNKDTSDFDYPYSTNDNLNSDGIIDNALSFLPNDLYENEWREWAERLIYGIPMRVTFAFYISNLIMLNWLKKYHFWDGYFIIQRFEIVRKVGEHYITTIDMHKRAPGNGITNAYLDVPA